MITLPLIHDLIERQSNLTQLNDKRELPELIKETEINLNKKRKDVTMTQSAEIIYNR